MSTSSAWNEMNEFLETWLMRIVVTVVIVAIYEWWRSGSSPFQYLNLHHDDDPSHHSTTHTHTLQYQDLGTSNSKNNRLLDRLEQDQKQRNVEKSQPSQNTTPATSGDDSNLFNLVDQKPRKPKHNSNREESSSVPQIETSEAFTTTNSNRSTENSNGTPPFQSTTNHHPGMDGFKHWHDVETSLYRIYTLGRSDQDVVPPYVPHSRRGNVKVYIHVTNRTNRIIRVYWVDYKGKRILKGEMRPNHVWTQTTYIDHPWVFEDSADQTPLLYYVPYRVIPTTKDVNTTTSDGTGKHEFSLMPAQASSSYHISVEDKVLPASQFYESLPAITWTLQHMSRLMSADSPEIDLLLKYFSNIVEHPENIKYRKIRIRGKQFQGIWNTALRGLILALGFVEVQGFVEIGCESKPLSRERIQDIALCTYLLNRWKEDNASSHHAPLTQPEGADGYGRAGFGRAGAM